MSLPPSPSAPSSTRLRPAFPCSAAPSASTARSSAELWSASWPPMKTRPTTTRISHCRIASPKAKNRSSSSARSREVKSELECIFRLLHEREEAHALHALHDPPQREQLEEPRPV